MLKLDKKKIIKYSDFISNYFYQQIAFYITYLLFKTNVTPNQITLLSLFLGILSGFFIFSKHIYLGIVFLNLSFIFDCVDGQLARAKSLFSKIGSFLDNMADRLVENIVLFALMFQYTYGYGILLAFTTLVFLNMLYSYLQDISIYGNRQYKKLSTIEKIIFSPVYFISRSMIIPMLSILIIKPVTFVYVLIFLYCYGVLFRVYREVTNV